MIDAKCKVNKMYRYYPLKRESSNSPRNLRVTTDIKLRGKDRTEIL